MEEVIATIGKSQYILEVVEAPEDRELGLRGVSELPTNEGMMFIFDELGSHPMNMDEMTIPLDILHLNGEGIIASISSATPNDSGMHGGEVESLFVIELSAGEANKQQLTVGDYIQLPAEFNEFVADRQGIGMAKNGGTATQSGTSVKMYETSLTDIPELDNHLQILDDKGKVISNIKEGARIFSRPHTKELMNLAMKGDDPGTLKELGKLMVAMIHKQDTQPPEYSN